MNRLVTITLRLNPHEARALGQMVKRMTFEHCDRLSSRFDRYSDGRLERDVMLDGVTSLQHALADAGFAPR